MTCDEWRLNTLFLIKSINFQRTAPITHWENKKWHNIQHFYQFSWNYLTAEHEKKMKKKKDLLQLFISISSWTGILIKILIHVYVAILYGLYSYVWLDKQVYLKYKQV